MTIDDHLAQAIRLVRQDNARLINLLRLVGVCVFLAWAAIFVTLLDGGETWARLMKGLPVYAVVALILWIGGRQSAKFLGLSRFSVPLIDIPMVTGLQYYSMIAAENPGLSAEFTIAVFVCLLMLSAMTLSHYQVLLALVMGVIGQKILEEKAGIGPGGKVMSTFILMFATWICIHAGRNRLRLVEAVTKAETKRRRLQRYFSPGIGELLEEHEGVSLGEGMECELTIVFTDIRGFTKLSENLDSREVVTLLNVIHSGMVEALFRHAGTLDKYTGDGLLAYFNAPIGQADHAERAIRCALDMQAELAEMNASRREQGFGEIEMGIGIHTGRAVVGDIGAPNRREFTAIGDAVNVASRLEQLTKEAGVEILVSSTTAALAPASLVLEEVGEFPIRGRGEALTLHTVKRSGSHD